MPRLAFACSLVFAVSACSTSPAHSENVKAQRSSPSTSDDDTATMTLDEYNSYCLFYLDEDGHPRSSRGPLLAIKPNLDGGWPTAKPVPLVPAYNSQLRSLRNQTRTNGSTKCPDYKLIEEGDELEISGKYGNFRLIYSKKISDDDEPARFKKTEFDLKAGTTTDGKALWYKTPEDHQDGIQYFVYMLDDEELDANPKKTRGQTKYQIYMIEAFVTKSLPDMKPVSACLNERPDYLRNVFPVPRAYRVCAYSGALENGVGTGEEPR